MALNVVSEARRCLNCKKPMCMEGCPISTEIPKMIQMFLNGEMEEAGEMLFDNNPLSVVCSLVCSHEKQCQGHCVLGRKGNPCAYLAVLKIIFPLLILTVSNLRNQRAMVKWLE